jgi:hypothetical protein
VAAVTLWHSCPPKSLPGVESIVSDIGRGSLLCPIGVSRFVLASRFNVPGSMGLTDHHDTDSSLINEMEGGTELVNVRFRAKSKRELSKPTNVATSAGHVPSNDKDSLTNSLSTITLSIWVPFTLSLSPQLELLSVLPLYFRVIDTRQP